MSFADTINAFLQTLADLEQQLTGLSKILIDEQHALSEKNATNIEQLAAKKFQLTGRIEQLETERRQYCRHLQFGPDKKSLQKWLAHNNVPDKHRIAQYWKNISYLGQKCSTQNRLNGILVAHMERHTRDALNILRGVLSEPEAYSNKGSHDTSQVKQIIAKA